MFPSFGAWSGHGLNKPDHDATSENRQGQPFGTPFPWTRHKENCNPLDGRRF